MYLSVSLRSRPWLPLRLSLWFEKLPMVTDQFKWGYFVRNNWFSSPFFSINFSKCCVRAKARHKNIPSRGSWPKLSVRKPWIEWKQLLVGQVFLIFLIQCHDVRRSYSSYFICLLIFCYSLGSTRFFKVARAKHRWVTVHCTLLMCSHVQWSS